MDNESMNVLHPEEEPNSATICSECEELSVCNCENDETVTVYETDDCCCMDECEAEESKMDKISRKCREVKETCQGTASRLIEDWKEAGGNPYIKQTHITQVEIYRNPEDEEPIDVFRTEQVKSYSSRSVAVIGAAAVVVACTVDRIMKKLFK